ncbi:hypothetical protein BJ508DRAFT_316169 [Ascobolus immersus RN42]|uniref:Uncharacterized protein n=1 Tax=Ascobolus immersus RN42 TaxID=1160509 RepID=A0A3N4HME3_ASCIM|nr:hypothetical protein BJ508DRAFT_316169 [Ascobolus immersus RN42]
MAAGTSSITGSFVSYIYGTFEIGSRIDKHPYLKVFHSEVLATSALLPGVIADEDPPSLINCPTKTVMEPSINSAAICCGTFGDYGCKEGIKITLNSIAEYPGALDDEEYMSNLPQVMPTNIITVGQIIPAIKDSTAIRPPEGWKSIDISTAFYDVDQRSKISFCIRWYFDSSKRWENYHMPQPGAIVSLNGTFLRRVKSESESGSLLAVLASNIDVILWGSTTSNANAAVSNQVTPKSSLRRGLRAGSSALKRRRLGVATTPSSLSSTAYDVGMMQNALPIVQEEDASQVGQATDASASSQLEQNDQGELLHDGSPSQSGGLGGKRQRKRGKKSEDVEV